VQPITFPRDEAPHHDLTEWWYYTGHLFTDDGARYGFEFVVFQVVRGDYPVIYVAHMAVTDGPRGRYWHDQRVQRGSQIGREDGFDLDVAGWRLRGALGADVIEAAADPYGLSLQLAATKPPVLHDGIGYFDYGPVGGSYYYSRTRMAVEGVLQDGDGAQPVHGQAWMDHQWGNFLVVGGWDWYSLQFDDQTELMLFFTRTPDGAPGLTCGTVVDADGAVEALHESDFTVEATGTWTSPRTGAVYPSGWQVAVPGRSLYVQLTPTQLDQELDSAATVGLAYWEGQVEVRGVQGDEPISGLGYVELTGYASTQPSTTAASSATAGGASSAVP
jgi:predicted secreted hydrolase